MRSALNVAVLFQGVPGFPGMPGMPGEKGHRVSWILSSLVRIISQLSLGL